MKRQHFRISIDACGNYDFDIDVFAFSVEVKERTVIVDGVALFLDHCSEASVVNVMEALKDKHKEQERLLEIENRDLKQKVSYQEDELNRPRTGITNVPLSGLSAITENVEERLLGGDHD